MAKIISTILYNDTVDGTKLVTMDNCVCQLYSITRDDDQFANHSNSLKIPALYILINKKIKKAYIGETDDFSKRIKDHLAKKDFWQEVLVFTANNNSLTKTEVLYLEALSYKEAATADTYDLSENSQTPTPPALTPILAIKTKLFFQDVLFLTKFVGCDLFEKSTVKVSKDIVKPLIEPATISTTSTDLKGKCTLSLNGEGNYPKRAFVHAVIKKVIDKYPTITYHELMATFPRDFLGYWSRWELLQKDLDVAKEKSEGKIRYYIKDSEILTSGDGVQFAVCTEWDSKNLINILGLVKALGWTYEIKK